MYEGIVTKLILVAENKSVINAGVLHKAYKRVTSNLVYTIVANIQLLQVQTYCCRADLTTDNRLLTVINCFSMCFVKCTPHRKMFEIEVSDLA